MLLHNDSFDTYATFLQRWDSFINAVSFSSAIVRNGTKSFNSNNGNAYLTKNLVAKQTLFTGFAFYLNALAIEACLIGFGDTGTGQIGISVDAAGVMRARRGQNPSGAVSGTVLGTTSLVYPFNQWHYLELFVTISGTTGIVNLVMDGNINLLSLTGQNTQNTANASANQIFLGIQNNSGGSNAFYDDYYLCDTLGNQFNTFPLGNVVIVGQLPVSNGTENDFQRGGGVINAQNWQQVNEVPPDDNTTYVFSNVVGQTERYLYPAVPQASGICYGGMLWPRLETDDAGTRKFQGVMASQGVIQQSGSDINAVQGYTDFGIPFAIDPATGLQYTLAGINAAESGIVITG